MNAILTHADTLHDAAMRRYNAAYDNARYAAATAGQSLGFCLGLIESAEALCGDPYSKLDLSIRGDDAEAFLALFCAESPAPEPCPLCGLPFEAAADERACGCLYDES